MTEQRTQLKLDYTVHPGAILEEHLDYQGFSHKQFADLAGLPAGLIADIVAGSAPIEPEAAEAFEKILNFSARLWLALEARYRRDLANGVEMFGAGGRSAKGRVSELLKARQTLAVRRWRSGRRASGPVAP